MFMKNKTLLKIGFNKQLEIKMRQLIWIYIVQAGLVSFDVYFLKV